MRRTSLFVTIALVAGLVIGYFARSAADMFQRRPQATDVAGIERANQEDIEATLARDPTRLKDLWAEDAVGLFPGRPPAVGREAIWVENQKFNTQYPSLKVLSYTSRMENLQVKDGLACAWFEKKAEFKLSPETPPVTWEFHGLGVLKRESDGVWRGMMLFPAVASPVKEK